MNPSTHFVVNCILAVIAIVFAIIVAVRHSKKSREIKKQQDHADSFKPKK